MPASQLDPVLESNQQTVGDLAKEEGAQGGGIPGPGTAALKSDAWAGQSPNQCWFLSWGRARSEPQAHGTGGTHLQRAHREPCDDQRRELAKQVYKRQEGFQHLGSRSVEGGTFCLSSQTQVSAEPAVLPGSGLIWKESG